MNKILPTSVFVTSQIFILIVGLIFLGGLYFVLNPRIEKLDWKTQGPITSAPSSFSFDLATPEEDLLTFEKNIVISGKTAPKAVVVVTNNNETNAFEANILGNFSKVIELDLGINHLVITAFDDHGDSKSFERNVYFTEERI